MVYLFHKFHENSSVTLRVILLTITQRIGGFTTMRPINLRFTYLLTDRGVNITPPTCGGGDEL